jgi:hypothetical protein
MVRDATSSDEWAESARPARSVRFPKQPRALRVQYRFRRDCWFLAGSNPALCVSNLTGLLMAKVTAGR